MCVRAARRNDIHQFCGDLGQQSIGFGEEAVVETTPPLANIDRKHLACQGLHLRPRPHLLNNPEEKIVDVIGKLKEMRLLGENINESSIHNGANTKEDDNIEEMILNSITTKRKYYAEILNTVIGTPEKSKNSNIWHMKCQML